MTEYEITDLMFTRFAQMDDQAVMYFTLVSAYLVAGYLVGKELSRVQMSIVNTLYVVWASATIFGMITSMQGAADFQAQLITMGAESVRDLEGRLHASTYAFNVIQASGILASLYFVWTVRRSKEG